MSHDSQERGGTAALDQGGGSVGRVMRAEMLEQPGVLRRFAQRRDEHVRRLRAALPHRPVGVLLIARGSSDQAAQLGRYLCEVYAGVPVSLAAPSVFTRYRGALQLGGWLAVAVSQSGETPEIVDVLLRAGQRGARTVAITNVHGSSLAQAADVALVLDAGPERAVPATKTVTTSMLALAYVAAALGDLPWTADTEQRMADAVGTVLVDDAAVADLADRCLAGHPVHIGRSFTYGVALEAALKFREATSRPAEGYATGDLLHGPVAALGERHVVVGYAASGPVLGDVIDTVVVGAKRGAHPWLVAAEDVAVPPPLHTIAVPAGLPEALSAFPMVARAQQLALSCAVRAGVDPDNPEGLRKVTGTS